MAAGSFSTFYEYFLFTKTWAYGLMFVTLPAFVVYWNYVLFPCKKKDGECGCCCSSEEDKH